MASRRRFSKDDIQSCISKLRGNHHHQLPSFLKILLKIFIRLGISQK